MRVFFIGTVEFSLHALQHLLREGTEIVVVCTKEVSTFKF